MQQRSEQWKVNFRELNSLRNAAELSPGGGMGSLIERVSHNDIEFARSEFAINAARSPAEAFREFDRTSKIEMVPAGEFATLTRLMQQSRSVSIGHEVFEYRKASDAGRGQTSMSGQIGVKLDHVDYSYAGTVIPVHDIGFGRRWREVEGMRADGFDAMVDDSRESERELMRTIDNYLWYGNEDISFKGNSWLGMKADPTVVQSTLTVDLSSDSSNSDDIRAEVRKQRDVLYITNNCTNPLKLGVSREIMSRWEDQVDTNSGNMWTILDYIKRLRGIEEVYEDSRLVGNEIALYWLDADQGFHPVTGMGISTYQIPRMLPNDNFNFVKWAAVGFLARTDHANRKCALYGS